MNKIAKDDLIDINKGLFQIKSKMKGCSYVDMSLFVMMVGLGDSAKMLKEKYPNTDLVENKKLPEQEIVVTLRS